MKALGLNHAAFSCSDLEQQLGYYEEVLGLHVTERTNGRVYLATRSGSDALVLTSRDQTALSGLAFQVGADNDVSDVRKALLAKDVRAEIHTDPHPGIDQSVNFSDPNRLQIELICEPRLHAAGPIRGVAPLRLGHTALVVRDVQETRKFYEHALGFRVGDWIGDYFVFMRCGHEHHTLNFIQSDHSRMQHIAFEMQNSAALTLSCDVLASAELKILWGPVRHGPGHNIATYHKNPAGQIIELYTEMDLMTNEGLGYYDPRPWHVDRPQKPKVWSVGGPQRDIWGPIGPQDFLKQGV